MITKSEFLDFIDAPIHFWAIKHNKASITSPSLFDQHLFEQGKKAEALAKEYVYSEIATRYSNPEIIWQPTYLTEHFEARADAVIYDQVSDAYDLYEIKGSSQIKTEHKYDVSFQALVCSATIKLRDHFIVHLDKEYIRRGENDPRQLFVTENVNQIVEKLRSDVSALANQAVYVEALADPGELEACYKPQNCVCLGLCHPELPDGSIYEINGLRVNKKQEFRKIGVDRIVDIPVDFELPIGQQRQVRATKNGKIIVAIDEIKAELETLEYPLHFLDYEAFNPSVPYFDGYRPFQYIPFQYSLHVLDRPNGSLKHFEYLDFEAGDPSLRLLKNLLEKIDDVGSIVVWNRAFEQSRHKEMAEHYPDYGEQLANWNERVFDLMVPFQKGMYCDPQVNGSYSIKKVLPAVIPSLSYSQLELSSGTEAMLLWDRIFRGEVPEDQKTVAKENLLHYCKLDTLAMVEILHFLTQLLAP